MAIAHLPVSAAPAAPTLTSPRRLLSALGTALVAALLIAGCATKDEITQPARYDKPPKLSYPAEAVAKDLQGTAMVYVQVHADGSLGTPGLVRSSGHEVLDKAALESVKRTRFLPARTRSGRTVDTTVQVPFRFVLDTGRTIEQKSDPKKPATTK